MSLRVIRLRLADVGFTQILNAVFTHPQAMLQIPTIDSTLEKTPRCRAGDTWYLGMACCRAARTWSNRWLGKLDFQRTRKTNRNWRDGGGGVGSRVPPRSAYSRWQP